MRNAGCQLISPLTITKIDWPTAVLQCDTVWQCCSVTLCDSVWQCGPTAVWTKRITFQKAQNLVVRKITKNYDVTLEMRNRSCHMEQSKKSIINSSAAGFVMRRPRPEFVFTFVKKKESVYNSNSDGRQLLDKPCNFYPKKKTQSNQTNQSDILFKNYYNSDRIRN